MFLANSHLFVPFMFAAITDLFMILVIFTCFRITTVISNLTMPMSLLLVLALIFGLLACHISCLSEVYFHRLCR